jgi:hypothetical protein
MVFISHGLYVCRRCRVVFFLFNFFIYLLHIYCFYENTKNNGQGQSRYQSHITGRCRAVGVKKRGTQDTSIHSLQYGFPRILEAVPQDQLGAFSDKKERKRKRKEKKRKKKKKKEKKKQITHS